MENPKVSIVILNWNGWEDTIECLESLYQINYPKYDVIVVDNASEDDSLKKIREYCSGGLQVESSFFEYNPDNKPIKVLESDIKFDSQNTDEINYKKKDPENAGKINNSIHKQLILIKNEDNLGFAGGNNVGIKFALKNLNPNYILLLNNDTVVDKNFLKELVDTSNTNEDVGILGSKIYYYDEPDVIWSAGCKISWKLSRGIQIATNELDKGQYDEQREVEYISGSAFFIKTEVIHKIGLMDEKYFLYFEESDWTLRANKAGYKTLYVPNANVWHKVSRSGGGISKPVGLYYITRNRWIFMRKWAKQSDYWIFVVYQVFCAVIFPLGISIYYRNQHLFLSYYQGLYNGIKSH